MTLHRSEKQKIVSKRVNRKINLKKLNHLTEKSTSAQNVTNSSSEMIDDNDIEIIDIKNFIQKLNTINHEINLLTNSTIPNHTIYLNLTNRLNMLKSDIDIIFNNKQYTELSNFVSQLKGKIWNLFGSYIQYD